MCLCIISHPGKNVKHPIIVGKKPNIVQPTAGATPDTALRAVRLLRNPHRKERLFTVGNLNIFPTLRRPFHAGSVNKRDRNGLLP